MITLKTKLGDIKVTCFFVDVADKDQWTVLESSMPEQFLDDIRKSIESGDAKPIRKCLNVTFLGKTWEDDTLGALLGVAPGLGDGDEIIAKFRKAMARPLHVSVYLLAPSPFTRRGGPFGTRDPFGPFGFGYPFGPFGSGSGLPRYMSELLRESEEMLELLSALGSGAEFPLEAYVKRLGKDAKCFCGTPNCDFQLAIDDEKRRQGLIK